MRASTAAAGERPEDLGSMPQASACSTSNAVGPVSSPKHRLSRIYTCEQGFQHISVDAIFGKKRFAKLTEEHLDESTTRRLCTHTERSARSVECKADGGGARACPAHSNTAAQRRQDNFCMILQGMPEQQIHTAAMKVKGKEGGHLARPCPPANLIAQQNG